MERDLAVGDGLLYVIDQAAMTEPPEKSEPTLDLRHIGRILDKDMVIGAPGMEMSKPGSPDMRRRKYTVQMPDRKPSSGPDNPPQTVR
jgi:hypothetical protein